MHPNSPDIDILFDFDGTLVTTELIHALAFRKAIRDLYGVKLTVEENCKMLIGKTDKEGLTDYLNYLIRSVNPAIGKYFDMERAIKKVLKLKDKYYAELSIRFSKLYPDVIGFLERMDGNYSMSVTSGSNSIEIDSTLNSLGIRHFFKIIVGGDSVSKSKPDPEPYLETARRLNVHPSRCIAIEDSPNGIKSAKAANMHVVAITNTHSKEVLESLSPNVVVNSFEEITEELILSLFEQ